MGSTCHICGKYYSRKSNLKHHIKQVHDMQETNHHITALEGASEMFLHPFTMGISGPTGCGKSEWVKQLLLSNTIQPAPERIIFLYKRWQPLYDTLHKTVQPKIEFMPEIPDNIDSDDFICPKVRNVLILDDLMTTATKDQRITNLFCEGSHHRNLSVIALNQNLYFGKDPTQRRNTQYLVLFKNAIDQMPVLTLARQMYPTNPNLLIKQFQEATEQPYGHLVVNLKPHTQDHLRLKANIFDDKTDDTTKPLDVHASSNDIKEPQKIKDNTPQNNSHKDNSLKEDSLNTPTKQKHAMSDLSEDDSDDLRSLGDIREVDDRCFLLLMTEAKIMNTKQWCTNYDVLLKRGIRGKHAITHAWDMMLPLDKKTFLELYENLLLKLLLLWGDYKHHTIFATALTLLNGKGGEESAVKEAVEKHKHLFDFNELQLKSEDTMDIGNETNQESEDDEVVASRSVEY